MVRSLLRHKFRPQVNALETRDCPAVLCTLAAGNLQILGDAGNNSVAITESASGGVDVVGDGTAFHFNNVNSIAVSTGDGNDTVRLAVNESGAGFGIRARIDLGTGDDVGSLAVRTSQNTTALPAVVPCIDVAFVGGIGNDNLSASVAPAGSALTPLGVGLLIGLDGGAGNDQLALNASSVAFLGKVNATLTGGDGNDSILQDFHANYILGATSIRLAGGNGNDSVYSLFDATGARSIYSAPVNLNVTGDAGDDTLFFQLGGPLSSSAGLSTALGNANDPVINAAFTTSFDGGDGNDTVIAKFKVAPQGTNKVYASVLGGAGDDRLTLDMVGVPANVFGLGFMDGGAGTDTHHASANVTVVNCEL